MGFQPDAPTNRMIVMPRGGSAVLSPGPRQPRSLGVVQCEGCGAAHAARACPWCARIHPKANA